MAVSITTSLIRIIQTQAVVIPRQVITQTITDVDYTTTAVVTLGPGEPSVVPPAAPSNPQSPQGPQGGSSSNIGIIIGSIAGAVVLALILWVGCVILRRRREEEIYEYENSTAVINYDMIQPPRQSYWPTFPASIPPPVEPNYRARPPQTTYTANGAARRATTSFIFYGGQGRG